MRASACRPRACAPPPTQTNNTHACMPCAHTCWEEATPVVAQVNDEAVNALTLTRQQQQRQQQRQQQQQQQVSRSSIMYLNVTITYLDVTSMPRGDTWRRAAWLLNLSVSCAGLWTHRQHARYAGVQQQHPPHPAPHPPTCASLSACLTAATVLELKVVRRRYPILPLLPGRPAEGLTPPHVA